MAEHSGVFLLQGADKLMPMEPAQFATEDDFQRLLSLFPELLVGDQIDPLNPRRWVLIGREQPIATGEVGGSQWSIDHVFLDQDGVPTLVEIKRQSDSRIRREVVGQMLDYAANCATYWSVETLRTEFEKTCDKKGESPEAVLTERLGLSGETEDFWQRVKTNLQAKKIRLLFVADVVPVELRRIVEFLNEQMDPAEVLAIELRQFAGKELKTLVPTVYGQTQGAKPRPLPRWDWASIFDKLAKTVGGGGKELDVATRVYEWMRKGGARELVFGTGRENGSVFPLLRPGSITINPVYLSTDGKLYIQFKALEGKPVFGSLESRRELMERFNAIQGVNFTEADLNKYKFISLKTIANDPNGVASLIAALTWMDKQIELAS
jgi:hypothetical protein